MVESHRARYAVGNWKMYKNIEETTAFVKGLIPQVKEGTVAVYLAVPFTAIKSAAEVAKDSKVVIGAQNMNDASEGAYTGEIAGKMLVDAGAKFVIVGHSERRTIFKESDDFINKKVKRALIDGLQPILCVGETQQERDLGKAQEVVKTQIVEGLKDISEKQLSTILIAYEPVWAIGTGQNATPEIAEEMHHFCRQVIGENWSAASGEKISLLYGGSVKPDNVKELDVQPNIDGFLIGGASLSLDSFVQIVNDMRQ